MQNVNEDIVDNALQGHGHGAGREGLAQDGGRWKRADHAEALIYAVQCRQESTHLSQYKPGPIGVFRKFTFNALWSTVNT